MIAKVSLEEYEYATESYMGWCTTCEDFTRDCTEPDAHDYDCPICEQNTVMGAEDALLSEIIEVVEE
jgi:Zn finger protein HypA/HybF involved in hydrogenase expression